MARRQRDVRRRCAEGGDGAGLGAGETHAAVDQSRRRPGGARRLPWVGPKGRQNALTMTAPVLHSTNTCIFVARSSHITTVALLSRPTDLGRNVPAGSTLPVDTVH